MMREHYQGRFATLQRKFLCWEMSIPNRDADQLLQLPRRDLE
jgi:hypothetical protein